MLRSLILGLCLTQVTLISPDNAKNGGDMLPNQFAGWRMEKVQKFSPAQLPQMAGGDADVLREYGFLAAERKEFTRSTGRLTVEALRMRDSSDAYGIFTYYRRPNWRQQRGRFYAAVGDGQAVLLRNSYCLRILGGEPGTEELSLLASALPTFRDEPLPSLPGFLPERGAIPGSLKYVLGPQAFGRLVPQMQPAALGFDMGAEAQLAQYRLPGKPEMTLLLVLYPTPQIAAAKLRTFGISDPALPIRRRGSLVFLVLNAPSKADADVLLDGVSYRTDVMWNQAVPRHREPSYVELLLNVFKLAGIMLLFALFSSLAFAGIRVAFQHFLPGRLFDRDAIIRLDLSR